MRLPAMDPFARSLALREIAELSEYLSGLPDSAPHPSELSEDARAAAASGYAAHCASCHGAHGEGHDGLFASRLCGQYASYMARRLREVAEGTRGNADAVMKGVLDGVPDAELAPIVLWLAEGKGCEAP